MRDSMISKSLNLFYQARKTNPYLKISDVELGRYHYKKNDLDSAFYYSRKAFEALPNNVIHSRFYFRTLAKLKKEDLLDSSFTKVKTNYILDQWRDYLFAKIEIGITPKEKLVDILNDAKDHVSDSDQFKALETIISVGYENLDDLGKLILKAEASYQQKNFIEAASFYESAARLNSMDYTHYENAALSYYRGNLFSEAEQLFKYTMRTFNPKKGKSEFYYGLLLYEKEMKDKACDFWNISQKKGFAGSQRIIEKFCK